MMRVLCLDAEGGYGGSSRSLFESIRHLYREVDVEVWCRKEGPIKARYSELGIPCHIMPTMPYTSAVPRFSRNVVSFGRFAASWNESGGFRRSLLEAASHRFDLVHFNLEGLFWLMRWLRLRMEPAFPITMHLRTTPPPNVFTRWQFRTIVRHAGRLIFITDANRRHAEMLAGKRVHGAEINNIVSIPAAVSPLPGLGDDQRFKVGIVSNYDYRRGIDRLIDIAASLAQRGRNDILFVVAGNIQLSRWIPGDLGALGAKGGSLADYAKEKGVADMFRFLGHVSDPYPVLAACDVLAKPTREFNPWGRDILEAMALGRPAMSVGTYDRFIENEVTGFLQQEFDVQAWADFILRLADDRQLCRRLGSAAACRIATLCDGPSRAGELLAVWRSAVDQMRSSRCAA